MRKRVLVRIAWRCLGWCMPVERVVEDYALLTAHTDLGTWLHEQRRKGGDGG